MNPFDQDPSEGLAVNVDGIGAEFTRQAGADTVGTASTSLGVVSDDLRRLVEALAVSGVEPVTGLLGGSYGYATAYENDVFGLHPFCWCDRDTCAWCAPCLCPDEAIVYLVDDQVVDAGFFFDTGGFNGSGARASRDVTELRCRNCTDPSRPAPNFWHKPSGTTVRWYKYIGRAMGVTCDTDWGTVIADCLTSLVNGTGRRTVVPPASTADH